MIFPGFMGTVGRSLLSLGSSAGMDRETPLLETKSYRVMFQGYLKVEYFPEELFLQ